MRSLASFGGFLVLVWASDVAAQESDPQPSATQFSPSSAEASASRRDDFATPRTVAAWFASDQIRDSIRPLPSPSTTRNTVYRIEAPVARFVGRLVAQDRTSLSVQSRSSVQSQADEQPRRFAIGREADVRVTEPLDAATLRRGDRVVIQGLASPGLRVRADRIIVLPRGRTGPNGRLGFIDTALPAIEFSAEIGGVSANQIAAVSLDALSLVDRGVLDNGSLLIRQTFAYPSETNLLAGGATPVTAPLSTRRVPFANVSGHAKYFLPGPRVRLSTGIPSTPVIAASVIVEPSEMLKRTSAERLVTTDRTALRVGEVVAVYFRADRPNRVWRLECLRGPV